MAAPKNITTNKQNIKKAVDQFGQAKVDTALAKQSAQGTNIVNTDTNTMVAGAGRYAGPDATGLNVVKTPVAAAPKPVTTPVATPEANMASTAEAETQGNAILPESVTGIKSNVVVSPTLQARIDAKKNGTPTVIDNQNKELQDLQARKQDAFAKVEASTKEMFAQSEKDTALMAQGYTKEEVDKAKADGVILPDKTKSSNTEPPVGGVVEQSDAEKAAQATGVPFQMQNGVAVYNPSTTEEASKVLAMGGKLAGETKMTAVAQASLNKVRGLGQMTDQQLANNIAGGQVSNKELELLNTINPQLVAQAKELSKKKIITNTTNEIQADNSMIIKGEEPTGMSKPLQDLVNKLATIDADTKSPAEMKTAYQDAHPEMIQSRDQINALTTQKRDLQLAKMNLWKEWKAKNSSYPISMITAGYSAASRDLDNQIYLINDDLNTEISNYNMYLDDMNAEIDFDIAQQGKEEQRLFDIYGVTSKEQIRNEDIQREDARIEQSIALEEQRYQRDIERDDMKSAQERKYKIEDMKNEMNMNIETGLMNLGVDPTGMTPEEMKATYAQATGFYKQQEMNLAQQKLDIEAYNANRSKASDYLKTTITNEDGSTREVFVNPMTGEQIDPAQAFGNANIDVGQVLSGYSAAGQELLSVPDGTIIPTRLGQVSPQNASIRGKECAEYVNDILGERKLGSTYASKLAVCDEPTGGIGSVVAWKPNGSGSFGHTGIIVGEDENNWLVKSSNYTPGTVTTDKIPKGNIKNFYTPESVKQAQEQANQTPTAKKYANGNIRTVDGVLIKKEDAYKVNKDIIGDKSYEAMIASEDMKTAWDTYKGLIDKYGVEVMPGSAKGEMATAYNGVLRAAQKFFALGVFQPYDQKAIEEMIPRYAPGVGGTLKLVPLITQPFVRSGLSGKRKGFEDFIQNKINNEYDSLTRKYGEYGDTLGALKDVNAIYQKISDSSLEDEYVPTND